MAVTKEDLQKRIEEVERELVELKAGYRVMDRLGGFSSEPHSEADSVKTMTIEDSGAIDLNDLEPPERVVRRMSTLHTDIIDLVERFGSQEFTLSHVEVALRNMGKGSESKHFKTRIATRIRKLFTEGTLTRTHEGVGSDPHKYRSASKIALVKDSLEEG